MSYCLLADLQKVVPAADLIQLTDDEATGAVNQARIDQAIADADDLIDTYLRGKHTVPLATVPPIIRRYSCSLALYYLYGRRIGFEPTEAMAAMYKEAIRFLADVRAGRAVINDAESAANTASFFKVNKTSSDRVYTSTRLDQF